MARPTPPPTAVLRGHVAPVNALSFYSNNEDNPSQYLISGSANGTIKMWDLETRREKHSEVGHSKAGILQVAKQGSKIVSHGRDGLIKWWTFDSEGVKEYQKIACGSYTFTKSHVIDDNLILIPTEHAEIIALYDLRTSSAAPSSIFNGKAQKAGMCMSMSFIPDMSTIGFPVIGYEGGSVSMYDMRTITPIVTHSVTQTSILSMDYVPSTKKIICATSGHELYDVDLNPTSATSTCIYTGRKEGYSCIANRPDDRIFATAGWDHKIRVFHRKYKPLACLSFHTESVYSIQFSHDNRWLASGSKDHKIGLWSIYPPSS